MPLRDFSCAACGTKREHFFWNSAVPTTCTCGGDLTMLPLAPTTLGKTAVFPFTSPHISGDGTPVVVESMSQLRRLEKQYGVVLSAFSQEPNNPDHIRDLPKQRVGGREYRR